MGPEQFELHSRLEKQHWWFAARRKIIGEIVERILPVQNSGTIVDVGCGTGGNVAELAVRYRCVGIDPSSQGIEFARRRFPRVEFVCGTAPADLGQVASEASLFLLMDVLEHVPDDRALLRDIVAAQKPGAQVLITVPADMSLWSEHDVSFGHYRRYDAQGLQQLWTGLPVTVRLLSYFNTRLYWAIKAVRTLNRWKGSASGRAGTDLGTLPAPLNGALQAVFAGEAGRLVSCLNGRSERTYRSGVSLIAVLRKDAE